MDKKIMLLVDEVIFEKIKFYLAIDYDFARSEVIINKLVADAEAEMARVKKELAEEIRVKLYEIISKHRIKELIPCQEDCLCWDIDNLKSFLEQKYAIGEK